MTRIAMTLMTLMFCLTLLPAPKHHLCVRVLSEDTLSFTNILPCPKGWTPYR